VSLAIHVAVHGHALGPLVAVRIMQGVEESSCKLYTGPPPDVVCDAMSEGEPRWFVGLRDPPQAS